MRVRIDEQIFAIQEFGGISRMFASLAKAFLDSPELGVEVTPFRLPVVNRYLLDDPETAQLLNAHKAKSWKTALGQYLVQPPNSRGVDVEHSTFYLPHGRPGRRSATSVVTVHDLIPELLPNTRRRLDFLTIKKHYVLSADHVVCVSEATRQDLIRVYPSVADRAHVVHHGVDPRFQPVPDAPSIIGHRYILFVGNRDQYKDAPLLISAFTRVASTHPDLHLLFVGGGSLSKEEISQVPADLRVRVHQRTVPDAQMPTVYSAAELLVFPSHFEGFGMPILEAMACGTPVIAARASSLPEVGGDACNYFTPGVVDELTDILGELLADEGARSLMSEQGRERAGTFTWGAAAARYADIYRQ